MTFRTTIASAGIAIFAVAGCASTGTVRTDFDASQNFSEYKSFGWTSEEPMQAFGDYPISGLMEQRFMNAIKTTLTNKGYTFVDDVREADFAVSFTVGARDQIEFVDSPPVFIPTDTWTYVAYDTGVHARDYHEGSLGIDIFDAEKRASVWHGIGEKRLSDKELRANGDPTEAVAEILAGFPPQ